MDASQASQLTAAHLIDLWQGTASATVHLNKRVLHPHTHTHTLTQSLIHRGSIESTGSC